MNTEKVAQPVPGKMDTEKMAQIVVSKMFNIEKLKAKISKFRTGDLMLFCVIVGQKLDNLGVLGAYGSDQLKPAIKKQQDLLAANPNETVVEVNYHGSA